MHARVSTPFSDIDISRWKGNGAFLLVLVQFHFSDLELPKASGFVSGLKDPASTREHRCSIALGVPFFLVSQNNIHNIQ